MQQFYGIDLGESGLLDDRSWRWLRVRIAGLVSVGESRLHAALYSDERR